VTDYQMLKAFVVAGTFFAAAPDGLATMRPEYGTAPMPHFGLLTNSTSAIAERSGIT
jgi:hypothetical protein